MSYSFSVKANTKADAKAAISAEFDKILVHQPIHSVDRAQAEAAAGAFIDLLVDDDSRDVNVAVYGSVGYSGSDPANITGAGINVSANLVLRTA